MSNIYFMCENCGIETNGITFVNGMKFCAKCYHQIFGKDNQQTEITQLKQQLAEKQNTIDEINKEFLQVKTQLAIQELEKVKELAVRLLDGFCHSINYSKKEFRGHRYVDFYDLIRGIDNQITELGGNQITELGGFEK